MLTARRLLTGLALLLAGATAARAQGVDLTEAPLADQCFRVELTMTLKGKITVQQQGETKSFPHEADAKHVYLERVLDASGAVADRTARHYQKAQATIAFNKQASKRAMRPERGNLMVAHRTKDRLVVFSPKGPLSREEMELTEHFDSLFIGGIVPAKSVNVGDTWKLATPVALALCDLDGLTEHDLTCKLETVNDGIANLTICGTATGIGAGAQVKVLVDARCEFDTKAKRVVRVTWKQSDQRQQGPVSPALSADVIWTLKRTPIAEPAELGKLVLPLIPADKTPPANLAAVQFRHAQGRYELQHGRDWHVVSPDDNAQLVLRLMDRGDFIAQATITPWKKGDPKLPMTPDAFHALVGGTPGWEEEQLLEKPAPLKDVGGNQVCRFTASGTLDGVKAVQAFYLVTGPRGDQLLVTFSIVPNQVQKMEARDLDLVRSVAFPSEEPAVKTPGGM